MAWSCGCFRNYYTIAWSVFLFKQKFRAHAGPDRFKNAIYTMEGETIVATWPENNQIANAHNEILQYLITMGIIGMISYVLMFFLVVKRAVKRGGTLHTAAAIAVFTYFCTVFIYNPQPLNYGILFFMFAIVNSENE